MITINKAYFQIIVNKFYKVELVFTIYNSGFRVSTFIKSLTATIDAGRK